MAIPKIRGVKRTKDGKSCLLEEVVVPLQQLKIILFDKNGDKLDSSSNTVAKSFRFAVEGPGVDMERVSRVELPNLDCSTSGAEAVARVWMVVWEDEEEK